MSGRQPLPERLARNERGFVLVFVALLTVVLLSATALVIDVGYAMSIRRALQASTDAAAAAAAMELSEKNGDPAATARLFSSVAGSKNARSAMAGATIQTQVKCTNFMANLLTGGSCTSATTPANTVTVTQRVSVPTFFAKVMGYNNLVVETMATAGMRGGGMPPLDVMIVLDTTRSMDGSCSGSVPGKSGPKRLDCAKYGVRELLTAFWPCPQSQGACGTVTDGNVSKPYDKVGLTIFPGLKTTVSLSKELDCHSNLGESDISPYGSSPVYTVVPLSSDYKTSFYSGLNGSVSNLVKSVVWADGNSCASGSYGVENPGGQGSYFADALTSAQAALSSAGRSDVQDVIVFVSDGDATRYTGGPANPCHMAVTVADTIAATGTWIYSVAYGASSSATSTCNNDSPRISALTTMQGIASDPSKFFNQPVSGDLTAVFKQIGQNLLTTRLLDDSTL